MANIKNLLKAISVTALMAIMATPANAHTISVGTANAGATGSVTVYLGTYQSGHGTVAPEGAITIGTQTVNFGNLISGGAKPSVLVDGVNNFFSSGAGSYTSATNTTGRTQVFWQSATLTGLTAGMHTYTISSMFTINWADWGGAGSNWTGTVDIPNSSVQTPEPAMLALFGLGLAGLGFSRKRAST
ncbi:MAG: PEP-CTERM sorting domain-containing protein [Gammaproteobacteria bacterium]|nr:PEP-CTERM sorting domain-containing protein [Gammaproteobacteria bacterium]